MYIINVGLHFGKSIKIQMSSKLRMQCEQHDTNFDKTHREVQYNDRI